MVARQSSSFQPIRSGSVALMKDGWKLIHYFGYEGYPDSFELYHLQDDPQERRDVFPKAPAALAQLKQELLDSLEDANRPYRRKN
jgi:arylsulfatase A-like enzyme